jgi:hypothetical protein
MLSQLLRVYQPPWKINQSFRKLETNVFLPGYHRPSTLENDEVSDSKTKPEVRQALEQAKPLKQELVSLAVSYLYTNRPRLVAESDTPNRYTADIAGLFRWNIDRQGRHSWVMDLVDNKVVDPFYVQLYRFDLHVIKAATVEQQVFSIVQETLNHKGILNDLHEPVAGPDPERVFATWIAHIVHTAIGAVYGTTSEKIVPSATIYFREHADKKAYSRAFRYGGIHASLQAYNIAWQYPLLLDELEREAPGLAPFLFYYFYEQRVNTTDEQWTPPRQWSGPVLETRGDLQELFSSSFRSRVFKKVRYAKPTTVALVLEHVRDLPAMEQEYVFEFVDSLGFFRATKAPATGLLYALLASRLMQTSYNEPKLAEIIRMIVEASKKKSIREFVEKELSLFLDYLTGKTTGFRGELDVDALHFRNWKDCYRAAYARYQSNLETVYRAVGYEVYDDTDLEIEFSIGTYHTRQIHNSDELYRLIHDHRLPIMTPPQTFSQSIIVGVWHKNKLRSILNFKREARQVATEPIKYVASSSVTGHRVPSAISRKIAKRYDQIFGKAEHISEPSYVF